MVKSIRLDPQLEQQLAQAADATGVPVSALIREAVSRYLETIQGRNLQTDLADVIGAIETGGGRAHQTGQSFTALLASRARS